MVTASSASGDLPCALYTSAAAATTSVVAKTGNTGERGRVRRSAAAAGAWTWAGLTLHVGVAGGGDGLQQRARAELVGGVGGEQGGENRRRVGHLQALAGSIWVRAHAGA